MNFNLTEEQAMLSDMVNRLLEAGDGLRTRRSRLAGEPHMAKNSWTAMAELGLLGLCIPEPYGGTATSEEESAIACSLVANALGRTLAAEPFISNAVVAASLLADVCTERQKKDLLPQLAAGTLKVVLAHAETNRSLDIASTRTVAKPVADGYVLRGRKLNVPDAGSADCFIVCARTSGALTDKDGLSLFLVDRSAPNLRLLCRAGFDGGEVAALSLDDVVVPSGALLGTRDAGFRPMQHAVHRGTATLLAEAVGAMERLVEITTEYLKTRRQFGQPLARFQVLQHQIADMATLVEQARSMSLMGVAASTGRNDAERAKSMAAAKSLVGRHALQIGKSAVQLHGGIGMTEELAVGHYFRRLMTINSTWGNAEEHLRYFADGLS